MTITPEIGERFLATIRGASRVRIGSHINPDGDTLGSALALHLFLGQLGVDSDVLCPSPTPRNLAFLPSVEVVSNDPEGSSADLGVLVDLESLGRLGKLRAAFEPLPHLIVIDHHQPAEAIGDLRIIDPTAPATAVLVLQLLLACNATITADMAMCLLTGLVTDTGGFRFRNTTPESLSTAAELLALGADIVKIAEEVYQRRPLAAVKLFARAVDNMKMAAQGRAAWSTITLEDFEDTGASDELTEGIANEILNIDTVEIAAMLRQPRPGVIRVSLRSRGKRDVAAIARQFGGGGHVNAAGCTWSGDMKDAEAQLVQAIVACLESS